MLTQLNMLKDLLPIKDYKQLYIAICYHDAVYVAGNKDNEEKSVEMFMRDFRKTFSDEELNRISSLIMSTKTGIKHDDIKKIKYADLIHDLDMISFMDFETMRSNDVKIRSEFSHLTPLEFYEYKLKYFKNLIKDGVFISEFYEKFNTTAVKNIKKYMKEIKELIREIKENQINESQEKNEENLNSDL
jgi:predicted metal-dependent HD superfamily phosphohydrolase